eukprot:1837079-Prymnesium_polylepis.1
MILEQGALSVWQSLFAVQILSIPMRPSCARARTGGGAFATGPAAGQAGIPGLPLITEHMNKKLDSLNTDLRMMKEVCNATADTPHMMALDPTSRALPLSPVPLMRTHRAMTRRQSSCRAT